jgi:hypothetical protein
VDIGITAGEIEPTLSLPDDVDGIRNTIDECKSPDFICCPHLLRILPFGYFIEQIGKKRALLLDVT